MVCGHGLLEKETTVTHKKNAPDKWDYVMLRAKATKCELKIVQNLIKSSKAKCVMMRGLGFACLSAEEKRSLLRLFWETAKAFAS